MVYIHSLKQIGIIITSVFMLLTFSFKRNTSILVFAEQIIGRKSSPCGLALRISWEISRHPKRDLNNNLHHFVDIFSQNTYKQIVHFQIQYLFKSPPLQSYIYKIRTKVLRAVPERHLAWQGRKDFKCCRCGDKGHGILFIASRHEMLEAVVQDLWKVTTNLLVSLGLIIFI